MRSMRSSRPERIARLKVLLLTIFFVLSGISDVQALAYKNVLRVRDGRVIDFEEMIREIGTNAMVFVGEEHGDDRHHKAQLDIIRGLHKRGVPLAIGLEMFRRDSQYQLDQWLSGDLDTKDFVKAYYDNWNLPWPLYREIFLYSRQEDIPMIGLNVPEALSKKVLSNGFQSLTPEELRRLPPGISCDIDREYMDFIRMAYRGHGKAGKSFVNFCEAQMVWDKSMAWRLIEYKKKNPSRTLVVLAGTGHSWRRGIPEQVRRASAFKTRVILPEVSPAAYGKVSIGDADYVLLR